MLSYPWATEATKQPHTRKVSCKFIPFLLHTLVLLSPLFFSVWQSLRVNTVFRLHFFGGSEWSLVLGHLLWGREEEETGWGGGGGGREMRLHTRLPNQSCTQPSRTLSLHYLSAQPSHLGHKRTQHCTGMLAAHKPTHPGLPTTQPLSAGHERQSLSGLHICIPPGDIKTGATRENLNRHLNLPNTRRVTPSW